MSPSRPRFSIVIPAYNEAHYIADTLSSLKAQTYKGDFEIIVVDNNSTDQTAVIARSLDAKVVAEPRSGVCWARQRGTETAKGEIIISTDADTTFSPEWMSKIDERFKANKRTVAVGGPCHYVNGPLWGEAYPFLLFGFISLIYKITRRTYYASATNIAFKKEAWNGYNTRLTQGGDELDLLRQLRKKGQVVFDNGNPTYTSARRLARGLVYNLFISFFLYYLLEYNLSRLFRRPILASAPKFRNELSPKILTIFHSAIAITVFFLFSIYTPPGHKLLKQELRIVKQTEMLVRRVQ